MSRSLRISSSWDRRKHLLLAVILRAHTSSSLVPVSSMLVSVPTVDLDSDRSACSSSSPPTAVSQQAMRSEDFVAACSSCSSSSLTPVSLHGGEVPHSVDFEAANSSRNSSNSARRQAASVAASRSPFSASPRTRCASASICWWSCKSKAQVASLSARLDETVLYSASSIRSCVASAARSSNSRRKVTTESSSRASSSASDPCSASRTAKARLPRRDASADAPSGLWAWRSTARRPNETARSRLGCSTPAQRRRTSTASQPSAHARRACCS
mmetsp:Transcript_140073/g.435646  ORF Transcript_140073/g.435646 Transcript_140073/m.435646 type:complete len:271 (-) Transcript_140073:334-1146(-)